MSTNVYQRDEDGKLLNWINPDMKALGISLEELKERDIKVLGIQQMFQPSNESGNRNEYPPIDFIEKVLYGQDTSRTILHEITARHSVMTDARSLLKIMKWIYRLFLLVGNPVPLPTTDEIRALAGFFKGNKILRELVIAESEDWKKSAEKQKRNYKDWINTLHSKNEGDKRRTIARTYHETVINRIKKGYEPSPASVPCQSSSNETQAQVSDIDFWDSMLGTGEPTQGVPAGYECDSDSDQTLSVPTDDEDDY